jgi:hypothetical protein
VDLPDFFREPPKETPLTVIAAGKKKPSKRLNPPAQSAKNWRRNARMQKSRRHL